VQQARATAEFLGVRPIDVCYSSPLQRAVQTASIICNPHGIAIQTVDMLTECDVGSWEGMDWQQIRYLDADIYHRYMSDPAVHGYPGGENFAQVHARATAAIEEILTREEGRTILIVSHHIVNRTYLAGLLGMPISQARSVSLDNCGISTVVRDGSKTAVTTLNASFHLQGVAA
jgi:broad specificity phosphatase PhoE